MKKLLGRFVKDESGATAIEYGLIAALLSVAILGTLTGVSSQLKETYEQIESELSTANGG